MSGAEHRADPPLSEAHRFLPTTASDGDDDAILHSIGLPLYGRRSLLCRCSYCDRVMRLPAEDLSGPQTGCSRPPAEVQAAVELASQEAAAQGGGICLAEADMIAVYCGGRIGACRSWPDLAADAAEHYAVDAVHGPTHVLTAESAAGRARLQSGRRRELAARHDLRPELAHALELALRRPFGRELAVEAEVLRLYRGAHQVEREAWLSMPRVGRGIWAHVERTGMRLGRAAPDSDAEMTAPRADAVACALRQLCRGSRES